MGVTDYIVPMDFVPKTTRYIPYCFTDHELKLLFEAALNVEPSVRYPYRHLVIGTIYRLIFFCGLRPNEGRKLLCSDVDLDNGTLLIRENKADKERIIPMSDDVLFMCRDYFEKLCVAIPNSKYFFPESSENPHSAKWLTRNFKNLWNSIKENNTARVRVYDLRHRFASTVLMRWLDDGKDLNAMMPYLSAYMGHTNLRDTAYYIHMLPKKLRKTSSIDWDRFNSIIPEVQYE